MVRPALTFVTILFAGLVPVAADVAAVRAESRPSLDLPECTSLPRESESVLGADLLDPRFKGLALDDLARLDLESFPESALLAGQALMVDTVIRAPEAVALGEILSTSIVHQRIDHWIVDVLGRHPRFSDGDTKKHKAGRVGLVRVRVPIGQAEGISDAGHPEVVLERSFSEMSLRVEVSIADWVAVVDDAALGFRRVFPLGGGGIDRGVRVAGVTTSLTPTTEDGLLETRYAYRELNNPWYFKNKPYLPISASRSYTRPDGSVHKYYAESKIAFHIWQAKGFERGYFSRGCMRMRTDDLTELAAFVFSAPRAIPIAIRIGQRPDVHHPVPLSEHYYEIVNYGTPEKPRYLLEWGQLYKTAPGTTPLPRPSELEALDFRERPVKPAPPPEAGGPAPDTTSARP